MSDLAPFDLEVGDVDWPDWMVNVPLLGDYVEGYERPPDEAPDPDESAREILALAKVDPGTWEVIKPYVRSK